jgi:hypothetical protein
MLLFALVALPSCGSPSGETRGSAGATSANVGSEGGTAQGGSAQGSATQASAAQDLADRACAALIDCGESTVADCSQSLGATILSESCVEQMEQASCAEHASDSPSYADTCFPPCDADAQCSVIVTGCNSVIQNGAEVELECGMVLSGMVSGSEVCLVSEDCHDSLVETDCIGEVDTYSCMDGCNQQGCVDTNTIDTCVVMGDARRRLTLRCDAVCESRGATSPGCGDLNGADSCRCE